MKGGLSSAEKGEETAGGSSTSAAAVQKELQEMKRKYDETQKTLDTLVELLRGRSVSGHQASVAAANQSRRFERNNILDGLV